MMVTRLLRCAHLLCAVWAMATARAAAPAPEVPVHRHTLANGLQVLVKADRRAPVAVSMIWYRVGSADEGNGQTGISHVLEHMMFKGTSTLAPGEFSRRIARAGGRDNAFTSRDYTVYHQRLPKEQLPLALSLEADRMANLRMSEEEFAREMRVVMEERRQRVEDSPHALLFEQLLATALLVNPERQPIIGWMHDLENLRLSDTQRWYDSWYAPNNATLVVAGDVDPDAVFDLAERHFGALAPRTLPQRKARHEPVQRGIRRIAVKASAELGQVVLAYRVPVLRDLDGGQEPYALWMLSEILDGHDAARLPRALVREAQIANQVSASYDGLGRASGLFVVSATLAPGRSPQEFEAAWRAQLRQVIEAGISQAEMKRVKAQAVASQIYQQDSVFAQASQIGRFNALGLPLDAATRLIRKLETVSPEQVREAARRYLLDDVLTVAVLEPQPIDQPRAQTLPEPTDEHR
ncbi:MAG TPA: pitrilysin family protein [Burkholderiales bacterium]|nr:pitrilysin family protein [Burkholderiales bacterium]